MPKIGITHSVVDTARPDLPLVSCVMPTYDRRRFVPEAIRLFQAQDYPARELIVVDDGTDPVEDLITPDDRIRYLRLHDRQTIGAKRNLGCEQARGSLIACWDDDDWFASWRLRYEVDALLAQKVDVVGLQTLLYLDPASERGWRYRYRSPGRSWAHEPTLCFRREVWEADRFLDANFGLDLAFLGGGHPKRLAILPDDRFYVGIIHDGNTSPKRTSDRSWTPHDVAAIRALMATDAEPAHQRSSAPLTAGALAG